FLPSDTPSLQPPALTPEEGAENSDDGDDGGDDLATPPITAAPDGEDGTPPALRGQLAFGSNLRSGPGLAYEVLAQAEAGTMLDILARDVLGRWLLVRTDDGVEAWAALVQFQQPLDILSVPVAENIPQPPDEGTAEPGEDSPEPGEEAVAFELPVGGEVQCKALTRPVQEPFAPPAADQQYVPYDEELAGERPGPMPAYQISRAQVPASIELSIDGNTTPADCDGGSGLCASLSFLLCANAAPGASADEFVHRQPISVIVGNQVGAEFEPAAVAEFLTAFQIVEE
ncbi:MAG TPA: SH3 domain-containing protein, partial [Aggregatilineales bacterium]|nr:SH3 domain-containing protein [Aggregatilineales bacterium]